MDVEVWTNLSQVGPSNVRRLRRKEYEDLVDAGHFDDEKVELIRGVIVRISPQGPPHAGPIEILNELLVLALAGRARIRIQLPINASDDSVPEPDIAVVAREDHFREHPSSAHLVIEVARTSADYDRGTKGPLYAAMGVPEFWVVDVTKLVVEVYRAPAGDRYEQVTTVRRGDAITLVAFPDVSVEVTAILPRSEVG